MFGLRRQVVDSRRSMPAQFLVNVLTMETLKEEDKPTAREKSRADPCGSAGVRSQKGPWSVFFWANRDFIMRDRRASIILSRSSRLAAWVRLVMRLFFVSLALWG